jgi:hypothetical protein
MLFASDLDQTLIYSKRFTLDPVSGYNLKTRLIETKDGEEISFMLESAISKLKELSNKLIFVPVTTRTIEQYNRISLFQNEIVPPFAIVSNGGNIINNGIIDQEWSSEIRRKLEFDCPDCSEILKEFSKIANENWIISQRKADDLFLYFIIDQNVIPHDELSCYEKWLNKSGWNMSIQGRKLYFVPNCISKWNAISYVKELSGSGKVCCAGDSILDLCMLEKSDYAITPGHGEIAKILNGRKSTDTKIYTTINLGMAAADEILDKINLTLQPSSPDPFSRAR